MSRKESHNLFYVPSEKIIRNTIKIEGPEFHHIKNVLRKKQDDILQFTDGRGNLYKTTVAEIKRDTMTVEIIEKTAHGRTWELSVDLAFVPVKGSRNDHVIEKGTELGVRKFILFISKNSVVKDLSNARADRYEKIAVSAMLQSQQYYLPEIVITDKIVTLFKEYDMTAVAEKAGTAQVPALGSHALLIVGPEGGFTHEEIQRFADNGAHLLSLGHNRLRSETAAIAGIVKILTAYRII